MTIGEGTSRLYISNSGELDNRCRKSLILNYTYVEVTDIDETREIDYGRDFPHAATQDPTLIYLSHLRSLL